MAQIKYRDPTTGNWVPLGLGSIATADTTTVDITGDGTSANPLKADVIPAGIPISSFTTATNVINMGAFTIQNLGGALGGLHAMNRNSSDLRYHQLSLSGGQPPFTICTSSTRPATPVAGQLIFETDTYKILQYTTATTGWQLPWSQPWGQMGYAQITANQAAITTITDLSGLSLTITYVANRRIRVTVSSMLFSTVATDLVVGYITNAAGTQLGRFHQQAGSTSSAGYIGSGAVILTTTAGSVTYKARAERNAGTGTITMYAATTYPSWILVEDIGPAANPT